MLRRLRNILTPAVLLAILGGFAPGVMVGAKRGVPFVGEERGWSIGVYAGDSPLSLQPLPGIANPVLTAADVTDIHATFVADPFWVQHDGVWHVFVEAMNAENGRGEIALATSADARTWTYQQVVLREEEHLSYPQVFEHDGRWWMIPEIADAGEVRLYVAEEFPTKWRKTATLLPGGFIDPTLFQHDGRWWMFASRGNDMLHLFFADELNGPWQEHPMSPVVRFNANYGRCGGRVIEYHGSLIRFAQDDFPEYGNQLYAFEIVALTPTQYEEHKLPTNPILTRGGDGWRSLGMHQIDAQQLPDGSWIAVVDGLGDRRVFGWGY